MTPEGKVKDDFKKWLKKQSALDIWGFWPVKRVEGVAGIPDWVGEIHGKMVCVEHKSTNGAPTTLQLLTHKAIRRAGGTVYVMSPENYDEVIFELELIIVAGPQ